MVTIKVGMVVYSTRGKRLGKVVGIYVNGNLVIENGEFLVSVKNVRDYKGRECDIDCWQEM